ncbi:MAG: class I SAM-dependent methyltransferase [Parcubacteria group bacterium]|jgi:glycosyltransferase involved in cell wall biosynthesis
MNWKYYNPKFEYEEKFEDSAWPWAGHKYFAYDLITNIKPEKIVELGTHYGTSLWCFSQSAKDQELNIEINAIDTWEGEEHAGFYGEEVFETVNDIKNRFYSQLKINLIRKTFNEAISDFQDNSIDILHIDGLHTYEAVKNDFKNWLPKLKKDGIILFHDIKVKEDDFGVYKFWEELKKEYITIEFFQSFGLGVLFLDENFGMEIKKSKEEWQMHYSYIYEMKKSQTIRQKDQTIQQRDQELHQKDQEIQQKNQEIGIKNQELHQKDQEIQQKNQEIGIKNQELENKECALQQQHFELNTIKKSLQWRIPNYFYKIYERRIRKYIPKRVFRFIDLIIRFINDLLKDKSVDDEIIIKWKKYFKKIKKDSTKKIILYVDRGIPEYDKDAGSFITFQYLKIFKNLGYDVIFWPQDKIKNESYANQIKNLGIELMFDEISPQCFLENFGKNLDIAMLSRPMAGVAFIYDLRKYSKAKIIYVGHDLHYLREKRGSGLGNKCDYKKTKLTEFSIMKKADSSLFFSDKEIEIIKKEDPTIKAITIPWIENISNKKTVIDLNKKNKIVFLGGFSHAPNADAVRWFHDEIYPILKRKISSFEVLIIGSNVPVEITEMQKDDFQIKGYIKEQDLEKIFSEARVFIAPLRFGAGFKGKIAKAMSFGIPVVTTEIGAEGVGLKDGISAFVTNNPDVFAEKISTLFLNDELWKRFSNESRKHITINYSIKNGKEKIEQIIEKMYN